MTFAFGLALVPGRAPAGEPDEGGTSKLAEIVAEEHAIPSEEGARDLAAFTTVIQAEELAGKVTDLAEVLESTAGVRVRSFGGLGDYATLSVRGSTSEQVMIYLDGVPLNLAQGGGVDLSTIPIENVERIEVYRGTAPAKYGLASIGGVVDIRTKRAGAEPLTSLTQGAGSFGTYLANLYHAEPLGAFDTILAATYERSRGDFTFHDDNGTPFNRADDETTLRENNAFESASALAKGGWVVRPGLKLGVSNDFFWKDEGVPGIGNFQSTDASLKTLRNLALCGLTWDRFLADSLRFEPSLSATYQRQAFLDRKGEIGVGAQDSVSSTLALDATSLFTYFWGTHQIWTGLADVREETFDTDQRLAQKRATPESHRTTVNLALEDEVSLFGERLVASPSARWTWIDSRFHGSVPYVSEEAGSDTVNEATWKIGGKLILVEGLALKGNLGTFIRPPSFAELFGDRGNVIGNPALTPERGFNKDFGLVAEAQSLGPIDRLRFEAAYFDNETKDLILFIQNSQRTSIAENVAKARTRGVETTAEAVALGWLRLSAVYTYQHPEDLSPIPSRHGKDLVGIPRNDASGHVEVFGERGKVYFETSFLDANFLDPANLVRVDARTILTAGFTLKFDPHLSVSIEGRNLGNDQVSDFAGFPLPGRSFFGRIDLAF